MSSRRSGSLMSMREVETSPDGRYIRLDDKLGSGAYKDVWRAFDTETGREVAWNTIDLTGLPDHEKERVRSETMILSRLSHPNVIEFLSSWDSVGNRHELCFATEIVNSGTLKQYVARVRGIKLKVIKSWCRQILSALNYLHHLNPPIIHRDVKCDNIFIQGSTSKVILGDFGLASSLYRSHAESVLGTPEFMAPELYEQDYTESVDIYSFGMCVLEMVTKEYPFEECSNAPQIWKRVSGGGKPQVLQRIQHRQVREFIEICIAKQEQRLTAEELLRHPFLDFEKSDPILDDQVVKVEERSEKDQEKVKVAEQIKREERDKAQRVLMEKEKEKAMGGGEQAIPPSSSVQQKALLNPPSTSNRHFPAPSDYSSAPPTPSSSLSTFGYSSTPTPTPPASPYNQLMIETTPASTPTAGDSRSGTPAQMMHSMMGQQHHMQQNHTRFSYATPQAQSQSRLSTSNSTGNLSSISSTSTVSSPPPGANYISHPNSFQPQPQQQQYYPSQQGIQASSHHYPHHHRQPSHHHIAYPHPPTSQHQPPPAYSHQPTAASITSQQQQQLALTSSRSVPHHLSSQQLPPGSIASSSSTPLHAPCPTRPLTSPTYTTPLSIAATTSSTPEAIASAPPTQSHTQAQAVAEVESFNPSAGVAHVNLHLQLSNRKKKQIRFEFSLSKDTASLIASEMVRALKLVDGEQMEKAIAQAMESKLGTLRKQWEKERQQQGQAQGQQQPRPSHPSQPQPQPQQSPQQQQQRNSQAGQPMVSPHHQPHQSHHHHHHHHHHHGQPHNPPPQSPSQGQSQPLSGPSQPSNRAQPSSQYGHPPQHTRSSSTHLPSGMLPSGAVSGRSAGQGGSTGTNLPGNGIEHHHHQQQQPPLPPPSPGHPHPHHSQLHHPSYSSSSHQPSSVSSHHYPPFHHYPGPITSHPIHPSSHSSMGSGSYGFAHGSLANLSSKGQSASPSSQIRKVSGTGPTQPPSQGQGQSQGQTASQHPSSSSVKSHGNSSISHPSSHSTSFHAPTHLPSTSSAATGTRLSQPLPQPPQPQPQHQSQGQIQQLHSQSPAPSSTSNRGLNASSSSSPSSQQQHQQHQHNQHQQLGSHHVQSQSQGQGHGGQIGVGSGSLPHPQSVSSIGPKPVPTKSDHQQLSHPQSQSHHTHAVQPGSKVISGTDGPRSSAAPDFGGCSVNAGQASNPASSTIPITRPSIRRYDTGEPTISAPPTLDPNMRRSNSAHSLTTLDQSQTSSALQSQELLPTPYQHQQQKHHQYVPSSRPSSVSPTKPASVAASSTGTALAPLTSLLPANPKTKGIMLTVPSASIYPSSAPSSVPVSPLLSTAPSLSMTAIPPSLSCGCSAGMPPTVPSFFSSTSSYSSTSSLSSPALEGPSIPASLLSAGTLSIPSYLSSIPITTPSINSAGTSVNGEAVDSRTSSMDGSPASSLASSISPSEIHSPPPTTLMPPMASAGSSITDRTLQLDAPFTTSSPSQLPLPQIASPLRSLPLPLLSSSSSGGSAGTGTNPTVSNSIITAGSSAITSVGTALAAAQQIKQITGNGSGIQCLQRTNNPSPVVAASGCDSSSPPPPFLSSPVPASSSVPLPPPLPFFSSSSSTCTAPPSLPLLSVSTILPKPRPLLKAASVPLLTAAVSSSTLGALAASQRRRMSSPSSSPSPPLGLGSPLMGGSAASTGASASLSPSPSSSPASSHSPSLRRSPLLLSSSPPINLPTFCPSLPVSNSVGGSVNSPLRSPSIRSSSPLLFSLGRRASSPSLSIVRSPILHSAASVFIPTVLTPLPTPLVQPTAAAADHPRGTNESEANSTIKKVETQMDQNNMISTPALAPVQPPSPSLPCVPVASASSNLLDRRSLSPMVTFTGSVDYADDSDKAESSKSPLSEVNLRLENRGRRTQEEQEPAEERTETHEQGTKDKVKNEEEGGKVWNSKTETALSPGHELDQSMVPKVAQQ